MVAFNFIRPKTAIIRPFLSHPTEILVGWVFISRNPTVFILRFLCNNRSDGKSVGQLNDK